MSEYQYYEFQTIDRRLDEKEMQELRGYSSRARITPTSFTNEYSLRSRHATLIGPARSCQTPGQRKRFRKTGLGAARGSFPQALLPGSPARKRDLIMARRTNSGGSRGNWTTCAALLRVQSADCFTGRRATSGRRTHPSVT